MEKPKPGDWLTESCYVADKIGERLIVIVRGVGESKDAVEKRGESIRGGNKGCRKRRNNRKSVDKGGE